MFYSNNIHSGIIYSYMFFGTNRGNLLSKKEVSVFLPDNYSSGYQVKLGFFIGSLICLLIISILQVVNLRVKFRTLIVNRMNEFYATDILTII